MAPKLTVVSGEKPEDTLRRWQRDIAAQPGTYAARLVTASVTVVDSDELLLVDTTGGAVVLTLPDASTVLGRRFTAKKTNAGANTVTLQGTGGQAIDGAATLAWATQHETHQLQAVLSATPATYGWVILPSYTPSAPSTQASVKIGSDVGPVGNATGSTALTDVTGLSLAVAANTEYAFEFYLLFLTSNVSVGYQLALTCPAGATIAYTATIPANSDSAGAAFVGYGTSSGDRVSPLASPASAVSLVARVTGILRTGANAGTLQVQHASESSAVGDNVTTKAGSAGMLFTLP